MEKKKTLSTWRFPSEISKNSKWWWKKTIWWKIDKIVPALSSGLGNFHRSFIHKLCHLEIQSTILEVILIHTTQKFIQGIPNNLGLFSIILFARIHTYLTSRPCMLQGLTWQATTSLDHSASAPSKYQPSQFHHN